MFDSGIKFCSFIMGETHAGFSQQGAQRQQRLDLEGLAARRM